MSIIEINDVSKVYRIGSSSDLESENTSSFVRLLRRPLTNYRKYRSLYTFTESELAARSNTRELLWALRDVSFSVQPGEVVGLVGANGAGKSTLLKVVSRIVYPTLGSVILKGRVSSLLEVGTGFHPELTGRENIYLSSTVLGMRKHEVDRKLAEIIDFSGVEKFIDTPVKRYSSGMGVRLAFAVMAHLEPEILVVDEVLAVGDAEFQRKCLNKMGAAGKDGRTVLFVSHNMAAVTRLCDRGILLQNGQVVLDSTAAEVVHRHVVADSGDPSSREWGSLEESPGDDCVRLRKVQVVSDSGAPLASVDASQPLGIQITYDVLEHGHVLSPYFTVASDAGVNLFSTADSSPQADAVIREPGRYISTAWVPGNLLAEGCHYVRVVMRSMQKKYQPFAERDIIAFNVVDNNFTAVASSWWEGRPAGLMMPKLDWSTEYVPPEMIIDG